MTSFSVPSSDLDINESTSISEAETSASVSLNPLKNRKKRKNNLGKSIRKDRVNKSHTAYFFRKDPNNNDIAYCKICEQNLAGTNKRSYPYSCKGGTTSNISNHLRDKHGITSHNYQDYLDTNQEVRNICKC